MNWDDSSISLHEFLTDWQRVTDHRRYQSRVGDSSNAAAARFIDALVDLEKHKGRVVVVVAHGGVTVDVLRTIAGDASVNGANMDLIPDVVPSLPSHNFVSQEASSRSSTTHRQTTSMTQRRTDLRDRR